MEIEEKYYVGYTKFDLCLYVYYNEESIQCFISLYDWKQIRRDDTQALLMSSHNICGRGCVCVGGGWRGVWLDKAKVSYILCHRGVQLILAYSWARPAILAAGKGRVERNVFISSFHSFSSIFLSPLSLSFISSTISPWEKIDSYS